MLKVPQTLNKLGLMLNTEGLFIENLKKFCNVSKKSTNAFIFQPRNTSAFNPKQEPKITLQPSIFKPRKIAKFGETTKVNKCINQVKNKSCSNNEPKTPKCSINQCKLANVVVKPTTPCNSTHVTPRNNTLIKPIVNQMIFRPRRPSRINATSALKKLLNYSMFKPRGIPKFGRDKEEGFYNYSREKKTCSLNDSKPLKKQLCKAKSNLNQIMANTPLSSCNALVTEQNNSIIVAPPESKISKSIKTKLKNMLSDPLHNKPNTISNATFNEKSNSSPSLYSLVKPIKRNKNTHKAPYRPYKKPHYDLFSLKAIKTSEIKGNAMKKIDFPKIETKRMKPITQGFPKRPIQSSKINKPVSTQKSVEIYPDSPVRRTPIKKNDIKQSLSNNNLKQIAVIRYKLFSPQDEKKLMSKKFSKRESKKEHIPSPKPIKETPVGNLVYTFKEKPIVEKDFIIIPKSSPFSWINNLSKNQNILKITPSSYITRVKSSWPDSKIHANESKLKSTSLKSIPKSDIHSNKSEVKTTNDQKTNLEPLLRVQKQNSISVQSIFNHSASKKAFDLLIERTLQSYNNNSQSDINDKSKKIHEKSLSHVGNKNSVIKTPKKKGTKPYDINKETDIIKANLTRVKLSSSNHFLTSTSSIGSSTKKETKNISKYKENFNVQTSLKTDTIKTKNVSSLDNEQKTVFKAPKSLVKIVIENKVNNKHDHDPLKESFLRLQHEVRRRDLIMETLIKSLRKQNLPVISIFDNFRQNKSNKDKSHKEVDPKIPPLSRGKHTLADGYSNIKS